MENEIQFMDAAKIKAMIVAHERQRADMNAALAANRKPDATLGQAIKLAGMLAIQSLWNRKQ